MWTNHRPSPGACPPGRGGSDLARPRAKCETNACGTRIGAGVAILIAVALTGCVSTPPPSSSEGIGFRKARFEQLSAMREYRQCREEAFDREKSAVGAGGDGAIAAYRASARALERCETDLGGAAKGVPVRERMRTYALAIQNHLKSGDPQAAKQALAKFESAFKGRDLIFADGGSFLESMETVLAAARPEDTGDLDRRDIGRTVRAEVRRLQRWHQR